MSARTSVHYLVVTGLTFVLLAATFAVPSTAAGSGLLGDDTPTVDLDGTASDLTSDLLDGLDGLDTLGERAELGDLEDLRYEKLVYLTTDELEELEQPLDHGAPLPEDSVGIGPGSTLITNFYDPEDDATYTGICTAAFVFRDIDNGALYLAAAGHCFMGETFASTHGDDADWDIANTQRIRVCVETCLGGATGLVTAAEGVYPGATRDLGDLVYARQSTGSDAVGHDFGIVEIPEDLWDEIRTDMPMWNGPRSAETPHVEQGDLIVHYGNGVAVGEVVPTKGRAGIGATSTDNAWYATSAASPGDSGSAVNIGSVTADDMVEGETAAGVLTHLVIGTSGGVIAGTNTDRGIEMTREDTGIELELIYDLAQLDGDGGSDPVDPDEPLTATIEASDQARAGSQITFDATGSTGDIESWQWDMGDGTVYDAGDTGAVVQHRYDRPGPKTVVLTVTDSDGETATATHRVRIQGPPAPE